MLVLCQQKEWDREGEWGHLQGDLHMLAVMAVCRNALVGTGWSDFCLVAQIGLENTALTL